MVSVLYIRVSHWIAIESNCPKIIRLDRNNRVMSYDPEISGDTNNDQVNSIAKDAIKLFRSGLTLIVVYFAILSFVKSTGEAAAVKSTVSSDYTIYGIIFWTGSMTTCIVTYAGARWALITDEKSVLSVIQREDILFNLITMALTGLLASLLSFISGVVEGLYNYGGSSGNLPVPIIMTIILISPIFLLGFYIVAIVMIGLLREVNSWIDERLDDMLEIIS